MQQSHLDLLAGQARRFLMRRQLRRELHQAASLAAVWLFVGPLLLLLVQWVRTFTQGAQPAVNLWLLIGVALLGPVLYIAARMVAVYRRYQPDRHVGLALFDAQLACQDRLVTADEFLAADGAQAGASRAFMQAAVDDAESFALTAMQTELAPLPMPHWHLRPVSALGALAAIAVALLLIFGFGGVNVGAHATKKETLAAALPTESVPPTENEQRLARQRDARRSRNSEQQATVLAQLQPSAPTGKEHSGKEEAAQGQSNTGSSAATQSASNSSNAAGQPSSEKNASKPNPDRQQPGDSKHRDQEKAANRPPAQQKSAQLAMESSAGEGKSAAAGSSGEFETPEQQDKANPGNVQENQGDDAADQDEEQKEKSNSASRPDLRDRKAPVDRNLNPRPTGNDSNDQANGRGGPGGSKKTRGVPSMILGIPVADRVRGKLSPGRSKVTQENATPTAESHPDIEAQQRLARDEMAGQIEQQPLLPWMQELVRSYFINAHALADHDRSTSKVTEQ